MQTCDQISRQASELGDGRRVLRDESKESSAIQYYAMAGWLGSIFIFFALSQHPSSRANPRSLCKGLVKDSPTRETRGRALRSCGSDLTFVGSMVRRE